MSPFVELVVMPLQKDPNIPHLVDLLTAIGPTKELKIAISGGSVLPILTNLFEFLLKQLTGGDVFLPIAMADERIVLPFGGSHEEINGFQARSRFPTSIEILQVTQESTTFRNINVTAQDYTRLVSSTLGDGSFDVIFLGIGPDGHCASLFPGASSMNGSLSSTFIPIFDSPKPPKTRISLSISAIVEARCVIFIVPYSAEKKVIVSKVKDLLSKDTTDSITSPFPAIEVTYQRSQSGRKTLWILDSEFSNMGYH